MKKLIKIVILLFSISVFAQDINVYNNSEIGLPQLFPTETITKVNTNIYNSYNVNTTGIQSIFPNKVYEINNNSLNNTTTIDIYNTTNAGIREIFPSQTIIIK